jgi:hypothetical protein
MCVMLVIRVLPVRVVVLAEPSKLCDSRVLST